MEAISKHVAQFFECLVICKFPTPRCLEKFNKTFDRTSALEYLEYLEYHGVLKLVLYGTSIGGAECVRGVLLTRQEKLMLFCFWQLRFFCLLLTQQCQPYNKHILTGFTHPSDSMLECLITECQFFARITYSALVRGPAFALRRTDITIDIINFPSCPCQQTRIQLLLLVIRPVFLLQTTVCFPRNTLQINNSSLRLLSACKILHSWKWFVHEELAGDPCS